MSHVGHERRFHPGLNLPRLTTFFAVAAALASCVAAFPAFFLDNGLPALIVSLHLFASLGAGRLIERNGGRVSFENRMLLGLVLLSAWNQFLAFSGLLVPLALELPLLILPALLLLPPTPVTRVGAVQPDERRSTLPESLAVCLAFSALVLAAFFAGAPPVYADTLLYHLGLPRQYLIQGGLSTALPRELVLQFQQSEMALLPLLSLDPTGRAASLLGVPLLAALAANVGRIAGVEGGQRSGWLAAAAVLSSPVLLAFCAYTKNDLMALAATAGAIAIVQEARKFERPASGRFVAAGFLAGAALAVKPSTALMIVPWFAVVAWSLRARLGVAMRFTASTAVLPASWIIRNLAVFGAPWSENYTMQSSATLSSGLATLPARLAHLFDAFHTVGAVLDGPLGPLIFAFGLLALVAVRERPDLRPLGVASGGGFLLWAFIGGDHPRFLLPVLLPLAACGAAARILSRTLAALLVLIIALVSLVTGSILLERSDGFLALQSGRVSSERFIERHLDSRALQRTASRSLPREAVVLTVGEPRIFYLERPVRFSLTWRPESVLAAAHASHDPAALAGTLKREGVTHILYNPALLRRSYESGDKPAPPCPHDIEVFLALLADPALSNPLALDPSTAGAGVYELR